MDEQKKLIKLSMRMLTEADSYAAKYRESKTKENILMSDLYYNLAQMHLEAYHKVRTAISSSMNNLKRTDPNSVMPEVYMMVKEVETDIYSDIEEKMRK